MLIGSCLLPQKNFNFIYIYFGIEIHFVINNKKHYLFSLIKGICYENKQLVATKKHTEF